MTPLSARVGHWLRSLPARWREWLPPLLAALIALLLTLPNIGGPADRLYPVQGDSVKYDALGKGLANFLSELPRALGALFSGGFGAEQYKRYGLDDWIFQHTPVYGWSLGAVYALTGGAEAAGRALSSWFFAGSCALLFLLARRRLGWIGAIAATLIFLFWPPSLYYATAIMTEAPMLFFALLAAFTLDRTRRAEGRLAVVAGGVALGLLVLSKATYKFVALPALLLDLWPRWRERGALRFIGLRLAGLLVAVLPFYGFLGLAHLDPDPLTKAGETALWLYRGNYVPDRGFENVGIGDPITPELEQASRLVASVPEGERRRALYQTALRLTVGKDPIGWVALVLSKLAWFWTYPAWKGDLAFWFGSLPPPLRLQPLLVLLALFGAAASLRRGRDGLLLALFALYVSMVHAATHLVSRYNIPVMGLAIPYAVLGVKEIVSWGRTAVTSQGAALKEQLLPLVRRLELPLALVLSLLALLVTRDQWRAITGGSAALGQSMAVAVDVLALLLWTVAALRDALRKKVALPVALASAALFPGLLALVAWGLGRDDPDPDRFRARLSRAGDRVEQTITLPAKFDWSSVDGAEVQLDLLPSVRPGYEFVVRVNGREVARMSPKLASQASAFDLDRDLFAVQDKWNRVSRSVARQYEQFVQPRHPDAGFEYFRQWIRLPVDLAMLSGASTIKIECELASTSGGYVDLFGDAEVRSDATGRVVMAPAFLSNAFDLSSYRFDLFSNDRMEADARLIRPMRLLSTRSDGAFFRGGAEGKDQGADPGRQAGEYRVRLRLHAAGRWFERGNGAQRGLVFSATPVPGDRPADLNAIRRLTVDRDDYFDGWRTF